MPNKRLPLFASLLCLLTTAGMCAEKAVLSESVEKEEDILARYLKVGAHVSIETSGTGYAVRLLHKEENKKLSKVTGVDTTIVNIDAEFIVFRAWREQHVEDSDEIVLRRVKRIIRRNAVVEIVVPEVDGLRKAAEQELEEHFER